ncbi:MAG: hypothetical protein WDM85_10420 [Caulobacteraceae bacterium]
MQTENSHLTEAQARYLTLHGAMQNEDGTYSWKFDNYVRASSPADFTAEEMQALWSNIGCPILFVNGKESWAFQSGDGRADAVFQGRPRRRVRTRRPLGPPPTGWTPSWRQCGGFCSEGLAARSRRLLFPASPSSPRS